VSHLRLLVAGTLALAGAAIGACRATTPVRACPGSLMPAYLHPPELLALAQRPGLPEYVVVNPDSGPGPAAREDYRRAIDALRAAGTDVLGYVATGWAARPVAAAQADIARYRDWYGVDGIFLDEAAHGPEALGYYAALGERVGGTLVLNPGVVPAPGYFDIADVVVTYEGPIDGYAERVRRMPAWVQALTPAQVAHLIYAASPAQARAALDPPPRAHAYVTTGTLPHPWGTMPDELAEERCP
jgi:hypothetical protein